MNDEQRNDLVKHRMERANDTLNEIGILLQNQFYNNAVNRLYYACFYAVSALLIKHGVETASHSGTRQKFGEQFVKTGLVNRDLAKHYSDLFEKRSKGDYNDFFDFDKETVLRLYPLTQQLISRIEELINE